MTKMIKDIKIYDGHKDKGVFKIWGHALEDLAIGGVWIYKNGVKLNVDS